MKFVITSEHELKDLRLNIEENNNYLYLTFKLVLKHPKKIKHNLITVKNILRQSPELRQELVTLFDCHNYNATVCNLIEVDNRRRNIEPLISIGSTGKTDITVSILKTQDNLDDINNLILSILESL